MAKRGALDAFFKVSTSPNKKIKIETDANDHSTTTIPTPNATTTHDPTETPNDAPYSSSKSSNHPSYPYPIAPLPSTLSKAIRAPNAPSTTPRTLDHLPDLDCLYYEPFLARQDADALFHYLRNSLFFYRVSYQIKRGGVGGMTINTPRFTTVFGVDTSSYFAPASAHDGTSLQSQNAQIKTDDDDRTSHLILHSTATNLSLPQNTTTKDPNIKDAKQTYKHIPRPLPHSLETLRLATEAATGARFNICLVNYYASGKDSISFHSDDERFLGLEPSIASFSLGGGRDFVLKHKPPAPSTSSFTSASTEKRGEHGGGKTKDTQPQPQPQLKLPLKSGDMILMRGGTQSNWLHSIPKRGGKRQDEIEGRINITFRRALVKGGTENYYTYNVGEGGVWRWDERKGEMGPWKGEGGRGG